MINKLLLDIDSENKNGEYLVPSEVQTKRGEPIDKALRRLKKKLDREGVLRELRNRRHYEKPSEIKRREEKRLAKRIAKESKLR